ncbi:MAG TPA: ABC transporter ATP-binding protein/permease [Candidatus Eisenbergiella stercorigallinarum]|uniref:ABC transporter ATP-binding protein/permease n=1 Tax=Candidatus Eisenbergiella stercorigallinarum TaxID=2838557 RepID=A0A9D2QZH2_9FIRM|nr:ABC transporter ATP-binding protein/permease [Candidatus Eisenbergiella stercorigallinarum]
MKKYSLGNHIGYLLKGIWESDKKLMALLIIETVCSVITPYIAMYLPKIGVDLATDGASVRRAAALLLAITCILILSQGLGSMASRGKTRLLDRVRSFYRIRLFCKTLDCDYEHVESTEWQDKYEQAKEMSVDWGPWSATTLMSEGIVKLGSAVVSFLLYGSILVSLSPWMLALILVLSAVNFLALRRAQKYEVSRIQERSGLQNRRGYMEQVASDMKYGKDIRLYELSGWIRQCFSHYNDAHFRLRQAVQQRFFHAAFVESLTLFVRDGIAYLWFLYQAASGMLSTGDFVLACSAVASFSTLVTQMSTSVGQLMQAVPPLDRMRSFLDAADEPEPDPAAVPPRKEEPVGIRFEDVCFSYGGRNRVLDHFSLSIEPGEKIALVGLNGAGKTTIIKLLCGFYRPESGRILLNGQDIRNFKKEDLYGLIAPVFQEATILPFTVAQNVAMSDENVDRDRVEESLKRVGLWEAVGRLPLGMDNGMTSLEEGGSSFSGGQKQKLLMARALYKGAQLLFFDEPTAALDPIAESETYEMFHSLSGNKTAVYISHRLASTLFCSRVVFLENGRVKACGSHEELMKTCGEYREMYDLQSQYYKKTDGLDAGAFA